MRTDLALVPSRVDASCKHVNVNVPHHFFGGKTILAIYRYFSCTTRKKAQRFIAVVRVRVSSDACGAFWQTSSLKLALSSLSNVVKTWRNGKVCFLWQEDLKKKSLWSCHRSFGGRITTVFPSMSRQHMLEPGFSFRSMSPQRVYRDQRQDRNDSTETPLIDLILRSTLFWEVSKNALQRTPKHRRMLNTF